LLGYKERNDEVKEVGKKYLRKDTPRHTGRKNTGEGKC
jgi:hypothetical protein